MINTVTLTLPHTSIIKSLWMTDLFNKNILCPFIFSHFCKTYYYIYTFMKRVYDTTLCDEVC